MLPCGFRNTALLLHVRDSSQDMGWERGVWEIGRGEYGGTEVKSIGNEALLALLLLEQCVAHLLRLLCHQRWMGKENRQDNYCSLCHTYPFSYYSVVHCRFILACLILYWIYSSVPPKIILGLLWNKHDPMSAKTFPVSAGTRCLSVVFILMEDLSECVEKCYYFKYNAL